jgi:hypothetical protein
MATHEPADDIAQEVERQLQLAIAAATLAAHKAIAHRQTRLAEAGAHSEARAAELRAQLDRQRTLASSRIQPVLDSAWWENATPTQVGEMWQETAQWRQPTPGGPPSDPVFERAAERIDQETHRRWELDVYDTAVLAHADDVAEHQGPTAASRASASHDAGVDSSRASTESYDTRARRERLQQRMVTAGAREDAIEARMVADTAQARPVTEAVQHEHGPRRGSHRSRPRNDVRQPQRNR